eukprot:comp23000_c0_seq5/m.36661 comp23000_c0_seq5/g.36661  ORF comp23000_c0_seq5/g.36661 comp23000_c0_seq5/m.36661 type:complete len:442 (-) comp23000_c0_seq5:109-1434(-)
MDHSAQNQPRVGGPMAPQPGVGPGEPSLAFHRVNSSQILYQTKKKVPKLVGRYILGDVLGEGSYGKVKEGIHSENLTRVAIKIMKKRKLRKIANGEANVKREIMLLRKLRHRHLITLHDVLYNEEKQKLYMVMEYCIGGLQDMVDSADGNRLPDWQAHAYFVQLMDGLQYLHSKGVIHRDIKPGNLLLSREGEIKISDLGVAEILDEFSPTDKCTSSSGSPAFQPPEIANGSSEFNGYKVDIWAAGVTLYNLVTGQYPFDGDNIFNLFENISKCHYSIPDYVSPMLADLLRGMLNKDENQRFTMDQIMHHPWVQATHPIDQPAAPLPITDVYNSTTLIPFLQNLYIDYAEDDPEGQARGQRLEISSDWLSERGSQSNFHDSLHDNNAHLRVPDASAHGQQPSPSVARETTNRTRTESVSSDGAPKPQQSTSPQAGAESAGG